MKKNNLLIFITLLLFCTIEVKSQSFSDDEVLENVVKIQCTSMNTNGNGTIIGIDSSFLYVMTASHVVDKSLIQNSDDVSPPKIELLFKKRRIALPPKISVAFKTDLFEIMKVYPKIDLAVLKVKHSLPKRFYQKKKHKRGIFDIYIPGVKPSFYLANSKDLYVSGYPVGATINIETLPNNLLTTDFFDNPKYFRITSKQLFEGHSGSGVYTPNGLVGMVISVKSEETKVLHLQEILSHFNEDNINHNLLIFHDLINYKWRIKKVEFLETPFQDRAELIEKDTLIINFDSLGHINGFINGTYRFTNSGVVILDVNQWYSKNLPSKNNTGFFTPTPVIKTGLELNFKYIFGFNFSQEPNESKKRPLETLMLGTKDMTIHLEEIRN